MRHVLSALLFVAGSMLCLVLASAACTIMAPDRSAPITEPTAAPAVQTPIEPVSLPTISPTPQPTPEDTVYVINGSVQEWKAMNLSSGKDFWRTFDWEYGGSRWKFTMRLYESVYETYRSKQRVRDYDVYASDPYDDAALREIAQWIAKEGRKRNADADDLAKFVVSFVQSLPYTSDKTTAGFDEYPRYPYETLYDNGGDCEDTSILAVALLKEIGYDAALIKLPQHMAVGIPCPQGYQGAYYEFSGKKYCYLETTGEDWPIGQIPPEYVDEKAELLLVRSRPYLEVTFNSSYSYFESGNVAMVNVDVLIRNAGTDIAHDANLLVALQASDQTKAHDQRRIALGDIPIDAAVVSRVYGLKTPRTEPFRIRVQAYGADVVSMERVSEYVLIR